MRRCAAQRARSARDAVRAPGYGAVRIYTAGAPLPAPRARARNDETAKPVAPTSPAPHASSRSRAPALTLRASAAVLVGLLLAHACSNPRREEAPPPEALRSRVDVYLSCSDAGPRGVGFELSAIELERPDGTRAPLTPTQKRVSSRELQRRLPLAGASAPPGQYSALVLHLERAWLSDGGAEVPLRLTAERGAAGVAALEQGSGLDCRLELDLALRRREAASIFLDWRAADSLAGGADFLPAFALTAEKPRATLGLLYVADAAAGTVVTVDRSSEEVVASCKAGPGARALVLSRDRRRLYVANESDGSLSVIDVHQSSLEATVGIGLTARCWDVVLADGEDRVAVTSRDLDRLTLVDGRLGARVAELKLGRGPTRLAAAPEQRRLFVLETGSEAVEVLDSSALAVVGRIGCEAGPSDLALDRNESELAIVHATSPNVLVVDVRSLAPQATIFVGPGATSVLCDRKRDRIYVARAHPDELVIVERRLAAVVRRIPLGGRVVALAQPLDGALLYGAAPDLGALLPIDVVLGRVEPAIRCGKRPMDVLVAD